MCQIYTSARGEIITISDPSSLDPGQTSTLVATVDWVQSLLIGEVGTGLAMLAVAGIGFAMLQGRVDFGRGVRVVIGCFILFGAPAVARGFLDLTRWTAGTPPAPATTPVFAPSPVPNTPTPASDPLAGAALPKQ